MMIGAVLLLQVFTSAYRIAQDPYRRRYLPVVDFVKRTAPPNTVIMGSSALGFGLGFDGQLVDDPRLGYNSGKVADFVVVGDVDYEQYFAGYSDQEPDVYRHITMRLARDYHVVYDWAGRRVYARR